MKKTIPYFLCALPDVYVNCAMETIVKVVFWHVLHTAEFIVYQVIARPR